METIVIKLGGVAAKSLSQEMLYTLKQWQAAGKQLIIIHGGGYVIDDLMANRQLPIEKCDGLRVTSEKGMLCVQQALCELVGPQLVGVLQDASLEAVHIQGHLGQIVQAELIAPEKYGLVGSVQNIQKDYLIKLLTNGLIPVLPSLGQTASGEWVNINADDIASSVAVAFQADQLIMMTDVSGVQEEGQVLSHLNPEEVTSKIHSGVITGNMIPKVLGACQAVWSGVGSVCIGKGLDGGTLVQESA